MYKNIDYIEQVEKFKSIGITNFTIVLFDEEEQEIENILKKIIQLFNKNRKYDKI